MPKIPKAPDKRRRTNKSAGATKLEAMEGVEHVPERWRALPDARPRPFGDVTSWHECTEQWWSEIVRSPMAAEFVAVDWHGLLRLAVLVDDYWHGGDPKLAAEIRQQQAAYGLTPVDRRRLQWEAAKGEAANRRRQPPPPAPSKRGDPRLRLVQGG